MFARIETCKVKDKKGFHAALQASILPMASTQPGFVDWMVLTSDYETDRTLVISLWKSKEEAERFHRETYERSLAALRSFLKHEPSTNFYEVDASTAHDTNIKAA